MAARRDRAARGAAVLISLLLVGLLLGLRHALEADHIAAVASLATRGASWRETLRVSAAWGIGHAATLVVFGGVLVLVGVNLPRGMATALEAVVGVMLVVLGLDVLRRLRRRKIHFHVHAHDHGVKHVHVHSHASDHGLSPARGRLAKHQHRAAPHDHPHPRGFAPRALLIGCVHGLAGTAGLVLLAVPTMGSGALALAYLAVFGVGTIFGMVGFSLLISVPLRITARRLGRVAVALEVVLGSANVALGSWIAVASISEILSK